MGGQTQGPSTQTQQQQTTQSSPWAPTIPYLQNTLKAIGDISSDVTQPQQAASESLIQSAGGIPNLAPQGINAVNQIFGSSTAPQAGILSGAYNTLQGNLSPYTDPNYLNPYNNPTISNVLSTTGEDISNQIKGTFAGAGRDLSPDYVKAMSRGLGQGFAAPLLNQYNANVGAAQGAAGSLFGGGTTTATTGAGLTLQDLQAKIAGLQAGQQLPGLIMQGPQAQLAAATQGYQLPYQNLATPLNMYLPIAGLGGTSVGQGTSSTTSQTPLLNTIMSGIGLGLGTYGALRSDVRSKENIEEVGLLYSGLPVYKYNYKDDPTKTTRVGLLAQQVELLHPEAVVEDAAGTKHVRYDLAA